MIVSILVLFRLASNLLTCEQRKQARQRRDYLYRRALTLKDAERNANRAKLRASMASGKPLEASISADKELRKDFQYDESRQDLTAEEMLELDDEYHLSGIQDPRVVVTTSRDPSSRLATFSKEIRLLFPTATRINRGNMIINDLVRGSQNAGQTDLITLHEKRGTPTALIVSHFPHGPTAKFSLHNVVLRGDIPGSLRGTVSEQYPHLIFDGFSTRLGNRVVKILKNLFPPMDPLNIKPKVGGRAVTFKVFKHLYMNGNMRANLGIVEL